MPFVSVLQLKGLQEGCRKATSGVRGSPGVGEKAGCVACACCHTDTSVVLPVALPKLHSNGGDLVCVWQVMKVAIAKSNPDKKCHAMSKNFL